MKAFSSDGKMIKSIQYTRADTTVSSKIPAGTSSYCRQDVPPGYSSHDQGEKVLPLYRMKYMASRNDRSKRKAFGKQKIVKKSLKKTKLLMLNSS